MKQEVFFLFFIIVSLCEAKGGGRGGGGRGGSRGGHRSSGFSSKSRHRSHGGSGYSGGVNSNPIPVPINYGYGSAFGKNGIPSDSYIAKNNFMNSQASSGSGFLTNALFHSTGSHFGNKVGSHDSLSRNRKLWDDDKDHNWRANTKRSYFGNKIPDSQLILPAAAVVGAATAFGLVSLLPLNVPTNKPLMYCKKETEDLAQAKILINNFVYECFGDKIITTDFDCFKIFTRDSFHRSKRGVCFGDESSECSNNQIIHCIDQTLTSRLNVFCNSTTNVNGHELVNCYEGNLEARKSSFIPISKKNTENSSLSLAAEIHIFLLKMLGKEHLTERSETSDAWLPEALTIPPVTIPPETTTPKMIWVKKSKDHIVLSESMQELFNKIYEANKNSKIFESYTKILSTTEAFTR